MSGMWARCRTADSRICLSNALNDIDTEENHQAAVAHAWATGDLAGMKANYSEITIFGCLQAVPKFAGPLGP